MWPGPSNACYRLACPLPRTPLGTVPAPGEYRWVSKPSRGFECPVPFPLVLLRTGHPEPFNSFENLSLNFAKVCSSQEEVERRNISNQKKVSTSATEQKRDKGTEIPLGAELHITRIQSALHCFGALDIHPVTVFHLSARKVRSSCPTFKEIPPRTVTLSDLISQTGLGLNT